MDFLKIFFKDSPVEESDKNDIRFKALKNGFWIVWWDDGWEDKSIGF